MNMVLPQKTPDARVAEITKLAVMAVGGQGGGVLTGWIEAMARAESLLSRLNIPEALWDLSPTTFSGGEQPRVNSARGFA